MHETLRESAGKAQLVKSARICEMALDPAVPQSSGLATIEASEMAKSAQVSAQSGLVALPVNWQSRTEFWMMELQRTLVVYLA